MQADAQETFGARLKRLMLARGFNQTRLARRTGIDRTVVNRLISGKGRPRPEHVVWLATALEVEVDELTAGAELSSDVRRAIDHLRNGADRMRCIETERDEAIRLAKQFALELARERAERELLRQHVARLERQLSTKEMSGSARTEGVSLGSGSTR